MEHSVYAMSDYYDDDRRDEPDASRSSGKDILWFFVLVLFMAVTVALIKTVFWAGVAVGAVGVAWLFWDEGRGGRQGNN